MLSDGYNGSLLSSLWTIFQMFRPRNEILSIPKKLLTLAKLNWCIDVFTLFMKKQIQLFIAPPNIIGATQLLNQVNQKLHSEYQAKKTKLFPHQWDKKLERQFEYQVLVLVLIRCKNISLRGQLYILKMKIQLHLVQNLLLFLHHWFSHACSY